jgi:TP901 family phage tail tape measure protein
MSNLIVRIIAQNLAKRGFTQAAGDVKRFEASVQKATQKLGRMALAAAAVSAIGLVKFAAFDTKIREIGTLLDDVTEKDIRRMKIEVEKMSIRFGQSVDKMAKAKYDIISAGFKSAADSAKLLEVSAKLAAIGVTDVAKTADVLTSILNAYGQSADMAADFSDILFTTVRLGKTTVDQLASGLGRAAAIAPQVGIKFDELGAAVATLTAGGQDTEEVMTALTAVMVTMLKPPPELSAKLKTLGFDSGETAFKSLGLAGTLEALTDKMTKAEIAAFFPNVRALKAIFPATGTLADKLGENIEAMGKRAGITDEKFGDMAKGIGFKLNQLKEIGERVFRRIGAQVAVLVQGFIAMEPAAQNAVIAVGALGLSFKFLGFKMTIVAGLIGVIFKTMETNFFGIGQWISEAVEKIESSIRGAVNNVIFMAETAKEVFTLNCDEIPKIVEEALTRILLETARHNSMMININKAFAEKYTEDWRTYIPDFVSMIGLGDIAKIEEKGAEVVTAVTEAVIVPLEAARMESAARTAEDEVKAFTGANKLVFKQAKVTGMQTFQMWNRNFRSIAQSGIYQIGQQVSQGVTQWFQKAVGQGKTWFAQLWRAVLQQFLQMIAAMTARWLAFKALTTMFGGPLGLLFSRGAIVGQEHMQKVQRAQTGMISQGFDTVPAMLRRGEAVIPTERTRENLPAIRQIMSGQSPSARGGGGGLNINVTNNISAIDSQGVSEFVSSEEFKNSIIQAIEDGKIQLSVNGQSLEGAF